MRAAAPLPAISRFQPDWIIQRNLNGKLRGARLNRNKSKFKLPWSFVLCGKISGRINDAIVDGLEKVLPIQFQMFAQWLRNALSIAMWVTSAWNQTTLATRTSYAKCYTGCRNSISECTFFVAWATMVFTHAPTRIHTTNETIEQINEKRKTKLFNDIRKRKKRNGCSLISGVETKTENEIALFLPLCLCLLICKWYA